MESARQRYNLGHFHFTGHKCVEKITTDGVSTFGAFEKMKRIFSIASVGILEKLWESPERHQTLHRVSGALSVSSTVNAKHRTRARFCSCVRCGLTSAGASH